jgi:hypothetical protein
MLAGEDFLAAENLAFLWYTVAGLEDAAAGSVILIKVNSFFCYAYIGLVLRKGAGEQASWQTSRATKATARRIGRHPGMDAG